MVESDAPLVVTRQGPLRGTRDGGLEVFRGIPFARPPRGPLRWRPPQPLEPWAEVRSARAFGAAAPQNAGMVARLLGSGGERQDEDCLTLNVWTPACDDGARPVLVWIHGGGFTVGSGSWPVFHGDALARRGDLVVVTFNYCLGALGFLALPEEGAANQGLRDQIAALEWVRENVAAFGGDPQRVTVFGNSAGAMSAGTLLAMPRARGLFRGAILQSGAAHNTSSLETAEQVAEAFAAELGLRPGQLDALRAVPVSELLAAQERTRLALRGQVRSLPFQPAVDGALLHRSPLGAIADGEAPPVPLLVGTNLEEWKFYGLADPKAQSLDGAALLRRCTRNLEDPDTAERVIETYRRARAGTPAGVPPELWFAIETDRWFRVPATRLAERHRGPVWSYLFTWRTPALGGVVGACHALEVPFVFGSDAETFERFAGDDAAAPVLAERMQDAWIAFARHGSPEHDGLPHWPRYVPPERATMILGDECGVEPAPFEAERAVWASIV